MYRLEWLRAVRRDHDEATGRADLDRDLATPADPRRCRIGVARHDRDRIDRVTVDDHFDRADIDPCRRLHDDVHVLRQARTDRRISGTRDAELHTDINTAA